MPELKKRGLFLRDMFSFVKTTGDVAFVVTVMSGLALKEGGGKYFIKI